MLVVENRWYGLAHRDYREFFNPIPSRSQWFSSIPIPAPRHRQVSFSFPSQSNQYFTFPPAISAIQLSRSTCSCFPRISRNASPVNSQRMEVFSYEQQLKIKLKMQNCLNWVTFLEYWSFIPVVFVLRRLISLLWVRNGKCSVFVPPSHDLQHGGVYLVTMDREFIDVTAPCLIADYGQRRINNVENGPMVSLQQGK